MTTSPPELSPAPTELDLSNLRARVRGCDPVRMNGIVQQVIGLIIESAGPAAHIGEICHVRYHRSKPPMLAEVVGFKSSRVLLMPLGDMSGVRAGAEVIGTGRDLEIAVGDHLLGRILDGLGNPLDSRDLIVPHHAQRYAINASPPDALRRKRITDKLHVGVRAIDALLAIGKGQRMGIFSGSGVGKSTMLGMIARNTSADINVICLTGERGREVREFIEQDLGEEGLRRSVVIVATSDKPPLVRLKAALVGTSIAEYFRDCGKDVMLMMDSVTRLAMSQREVGLAVGEPPATRGYTPSVFALLPKLLERSGTGEKGTITALYTVLVDGDDMNEPIADTVRGILDGHIVLSRSLAAKNHYPAIDVAGSISRVMDQIVSPDQLQAAGDIRNAMSTFREAEDLISIGAYVEGSNPAIDRARRLMPGISSFLRQREHEFTTPADTQEMLMRLVNDEAI
jgi:flagellum-specific ATP synthase